jgi:hypothetical protein
MQLRIRASRPRPIARRFRKYRLRQYGTGVITKAILIYVLHQRNRCKRKRFCDMQGAQYLKVRRPGSAGEDASLFMVKLRVLGF